MNEVGGFRVISDEAHRLATQEREEKEARRVKMLAWMRQDLADRHFRRDMAPRKPIPSSALAL